MNIAYYVTKKKTSKKLFTIFRKKSIVILLLLIFGSLSGATAYLTYYGQKVGNFVVGVTGDSSEVGLALSEDKGFAYSTPSLTGGALTDIVPIPKTQVYKELVINSKSASFISKEGNYMGYRFYLKNVGKTIVDVEYSLNIDMATHYVDRAIRTWVFNGEEDTIGTIYQKEDEKPTEYANYPEVEYFSSDDLIFRKIIHNFGVNEVRQFVVIFWLEGDDPDCTDTGDYALLSGTIKFSMSFKVSENE